MAMRGRAAGASEDGRQRIECVRLGRKVTGSVAPAGPGRETMTRWTLLAALALLLAPVGAAAQDAAPVRAAHEDLEPGTRTDDLGITIGMPASYPARRYPASHDFPTGPEIGERLPEFSLPNQQGRLVDYHADRGGSKSVVVFYRSAVW